MTELRDGRVDRWTHTTQSHSDHLKEIPDVGIECDLHRVGRNATRQTQDDKHRHRHTRTQTQQKTRSNETTTRGFRQSVLASEQNEYILIKSKNKTTIQTEHHTTIGVIDHELLGGRACN